jgi:hypothetical protein
MSWPCKPSGGLIKNLDFNYGLVAGVILTLIILKVLGRL